MVTAFLDEEEDKRWNGPLLPVSEPLHQPRLLYSGRDFSSLVLGTGGE